MEWAQATKPASAFREKHRLDKIIEYFKDQGILTLKAITPLAIEGLRAHLLEAGGKKKDPEGNIKLCGLSRTTVNRYLQLLRGMFYRAADWGLWSGPNPLRKIRFFREEHKIIGFDSGQVTALLKAAQELWAKPKSRRQASFGDLILFDLNTGLRKSELLYLRWADIVLSYALFSGKIPQESRNLRLTTLIILR